MSKKLLIAFLIIIIVSLVFFADYLHSRYLYTKYMQQLQGPCIMSVKEKPIQNRGLNFIEENPLWVFIEDMFIGNSC